MTFLDAGAKLQEVVGYIDRALIAVGKGKSHNVIASLHQAKLILDEILVEAKKREEFMEEMSKARAEGVSIADIAKAMFERAALIETKGEEAEALQGPTQTEPAAAVAVVVS